MKKFFKRFALTIVILLVVFVSYFFSIKKLNRNVLEAENTYTPSYTAGKPVLLPSTFINGERFFIKIKSATGDTMLGFCDTGGGSSFIFSSTVAQFKLGNITKTALAMGVMPLGYILFTDVTPDKNIPPPVPLRSMVLRTPFARITEPFLMIPPDDEELKFMQKSMPDMHVFFGQNFFMARAWTLDYLNQKIWVNTPLTPGDTLHGKIQPLGFKKNSKGAAIYGHPSMNIKIDGEIIDVLFDTGATLVLSEKGKKDFKTNKPTRGGSFIAASVFDRWRNKHPEWPYYKKADANADVIEVPEITIGDYTAGPVLFAKRSDKNWSEGMIAGMDKVVKGAIGGSALKYFKVTIDYNNALIKFEQ